MTQITLEQIIRDLLECAVEGGLVSQNDQWADHRPQVRSAGELVAVANLLSQRLKESGDGKLEAFGSAVLAELKDCIVSGAWHMDAGKLADTAVECGLMEHVAYDPTKHKIDLYSCYVEVGDMMYYWGDNV